MPTRPVLRIVTFITASAIVGLAAAFVAVVVRPELIARRTSPQPAPQPAPAAPVNTPAPAATAPTVAVPEPAARLANSYADAVDRAAPAVVNIYTARAVTELIRPSAFEQLFGDAAPRYRQRTEQSLGSGVIMDSTGHVITNHHVIDKADRIRVLLADGRIAEATVWRSAIRSACRRPLPRESSAPPAAHS
jgi:S1-C subfamily serine protease